MIFYKSHDLLAARPHQYIAMVNRSPPASVVASWPTPNYADPVTRGPQLRIVALLGLILVWLTVGLRLYVRGFILKAFGIDDVFIAMALVGIYSRAGLNELR